MCTYIDTLGPHWFRCSTRPLPTLGKCVLVESSPETDTGTRIQVKVVCLGGEGRRVKRRDGEGKAVDKECLLEPVPTEGDRA